MSAILGDDFESLLKLDAEKSMQLARLGKSYEAAIGEASTLRKELINTAHAWAIETEAIYAENMDLIHRQIEALLLRESMIKDLKAELCRPCERCGFQK